MGSSRDRIKKVVGVLSGAKEAAGNYLNAGVTHLRTARMQGKLADKMMDKEYVSSTMGETTHSQRREDIMPTIKGGNMVQAREYLRNKKRLFKIANPDYTGK